MSNLNLTRKGLAPTRSNDLFDSGNFFSPFFWDFFGNGNSTALDLARQIPSVNINETEKDYQLEMAAPGLERNDFKVEVEQGVLYISSEKELERKDERKNYTRREYSYNSFSRSFTLPDNCMPDNIVAKYDKGILHITLPKKEVSVSKPAKEIKVS
ncbi:MAG: Hsp20/alpha crystallin family protein [Bacteroidota bacterium]